MPPPRPCGLLSQIIRVSQSVWYGISIGAVVMACLSSLKACWCGVDHSNLVSDLVSFLSSSQCCEKLSMYLDRYVSICKNETSSSYNSV